MPQVACAVAVADVLHTCSCRICGRRMATNGHGDNHGAWRLPEAARNAGEVMARAFRRVIQLHRGKLDPRPIHYRGSSRGVILIRAIQHTGEHITRLLWLGVLGSSATLPFGERLPLLLATE